MALGGYLALLEFGTFYGQPLAGHQMRSIEIKYREGDVLLILKKWHGKKPMIAFVGAYNLEQALQRAVYQLQHKELKWKLDEWEMRRIDRKELID